MSGVCGSASLGESRPGVAPGRDEGYVASVSTTKPGRLDGTRYGYGPTRKDAYGDLVEILARSKETMVGKPDVRRERPGDAGGEPGSADR